MKPSIHFTCKNEKCSAFEREASISYRPFWKNSISENSENKEEEWMRHRICPKCFQQQGMLSIKHANQEFNDIGEYEQHIEKLIETSKLLVRLVNAGIGNSQEVERLTINKGYLENASCPFCGGAALDAIENKHVS